jgi:hypothetical protein
MSEAITRRQIEIPWSHTVFSGLVDIVETEIREKESTVTEVTGDRSNLRMTYDVPVPAGALEKFARPLAESDIDRVPDNPDEFAVASVDVTVEELATVTIEVYSE